MTTPYRITWEIELEADNPVHAARQALALHREPRSWATVFTIHPHGDTQALIVDLDPKHLDPSGNGTPRVTPV
ncbi:hypothetical protein ACFYOY_36250 [Streptomyces sp. NPDC007875]|uniref:hypothetical protein n=1 Tax=Streptomyces sp. NPDC007875 TaxID=3364783 RepID=UPI0036CC9F16